MANHRQDSDLSLVHVSTLLSTKGEGDFQKGEGPAIPPSLPKLKISWKKTIRKKRIKQWEKIVGKRYHFMTATGWLLPYFIQRGKQSCDTFTFPGGPWDVKWPNQQALQFHLSHISPNGKSYLMMHLFSKQAVGCRMSNEQTAGQPTRPSFQKPCSGPEYGF